MVARYNPCGRVVDLGHDAGRVRARLYPDSDEEFEILWYVARDDAPLLGFPSAINNWKLVKDIEKDEPVSVGQVPFARFTKRPNQPNLLAIGDHFCGTLADFAGDGVFEPDLPPVEYRPDGLPFCCGALFMGTGGAVLGGVASVVPAFVGRGGAVLGGVASVVAAFVGTGGLVASGTADVVRAFVGTGGLVAGGVADVLVAALRIGTGGVVAGGMADVFEGVVILGTGGVVAGGVADVFEGVVILGTGGVVAGGVAGLMVGRIGTGGVVAGGVADVSAGALRIGTGGAIAGGTATVTATSGAPTLVSASIASNGTTLTLTWSVAVTHAGGAVGTTGTQTSTGTYASGSGTSVLIWNLFPPIYSGSSQVLNVAAGVVTAGASGNAAITGAAITNSSTQTPAVPGSSCATAGTMLADVPVTVPTTAGGAALYLQFPISSGVQYHVEVSGYTSIGSVSLDNMVTCAGRTFVDIFGFDDCRAYTPGTTGFGLLIIQPGFFSAGSVTVEFGAGPC